MEVKLPIKGIKRNTSLINEQDGFCSELINLRSKDEEWQSIQPPTKKIEFSMDADSDDIFFHHRILSDNQVIYWSALTENLSIAETNTGNLLLTIANIPRVTKIAEYGIILLVITENNAYYFKYDKDTASYIELPKIQHGRYLFSDTNRETFGKAFTPTQTNWVAEGISLVLERKRGLEQQGKFNGHVFFRMAFKTFDGEFIEYSPIYYRNIGYTETFPEAVPNIRNDTGAGTYNYSWGQWAQPQYNFSFTQEQLQIINSYKHLIESFCIFMSPPHYDWDTNADEGALKSFTSGTVNYRFYPHTSSIEDYFANNNSFYLVKEITLEDLANQLETYGGTFTPSDNNATPLPNPPVTAIKNVVITLENTYGAFTYIEDEDYTIDYLNKTITLLPVTTVQGWSYFAPSIAFPVPLGHKNLISLNAYSGATTYSVGILGNPADSTKDFLVDYPNGTVTCNNASLVHTEVSFDYSYGMELGLTYTASFGTPLSAALETGDIGTLQTKLALTVDNFTSHRYFSEVLYEYNSRMHLGAVKTKLSKVVNFTSYDTNDQGHLPAGYTAVQDANNKTWQFIAVVTLETDDGTKMVVTELTDIGVFNDGTNDFACMNPIVMYPDERAKSMTILGLSAGEYHTVMSKQSMVSHTYGNFAFFINEAANTLVNYGTTSVPSTIDITSVRILKYKMLQLTLGDIVAAPQVKNIVTDKNRVQVSAVNNLLIYPAKNSYRIGRLSSKVVGISSQAVAVSVAQFGQYPVYVFTDDGLFTMEQGQGEVLYASIHPISLYSTNNPDSIINVEQGILFATGHGLFIVSGSQITELTIPLRGEPENFINNLTAFTNVETALPTTLSTDDFIEWMSDAKFGYDKINHEIIISKDYSYIFNLKHETWYKTTNSYDKFITIGEETFGINIKTGVETWRHNFYNLDQPDDSTDVTSYIITRPVKFGTNGLKSISRAAVRLVADMATQTPNPLSFHVYGSLNGYEWQLIQGKDYTDFTGKDFVLELPKVSARYFIFILAIKSKVIRVNDFETDVEAVANTKLR